jgi:hypothetical protein
MHCPQESHCQNQEQPGTMTDRMDQIIEAAEQQGFEVRQTAEATWIFRKGLNTIIQPASCQHGRVAELCRRAA